MKLPNGFGSVYKNSGKRRKPWVARITVGWEINEEAKRGKQKYKNIGTFATRSEALNALSNYHQNPYNLDTQGILFSECYERWSKEYYATLKNPSSARSYIASYKYCKPLYLMRMRDIRVEHMQGVIKDCAAGEATKARMKSMFNMIYRWCMVHELIDKNYAALFDSVKVESKIKRTPYTAEEIKALWEHESFSCIDVILFALYSGCRPMEIFTIKTVDVHLEDNYLRGGIKTEAGIFRVIPIHDKIKHIVEANYNKEHEYLFMNNKNNSNPIPMTYDVFKSRHKRALESLNITHYPADSRHTFITHAKEIDMNEYVLKLIVGHYIDDVTEKTYTHRKIKELIAAINTIDYEKVLP